MIYDYELADIVNEAEQIGYNKGIDYFVEGIQLEYLNGFGIKQEDIEFLTAVSIKLAERLKEGV